MTDFTSLPGGTPAGLAASATGIGVEQGGGILHLVIYDADQSPAAATPIADCLFPTGQSASGTDVCTTQVTAPAGTVHHYIAYESDPNLPPDQWLPSGTVTVTWN